MDQTDFSRFDYESYSYTTDTTGRFNALAKYFAIMDQQVAGIQIELAEQLRQDLQAIPDSWSDADRHSFVGWRESEYQQVRSSFPESFRYSFIVLVWLVVEDELKRVAAEVQRRKELSPKQWERKGVIEQCMSILKEIAGITEKQIAHWPAICDLQKVRDCIVHTSGFVEKSRDKKYLKKLVERDRLGLHINDYNKRLVFEAEFCEQAIKNAAEFFAEVFHAVGIKIWKEG